MPFASASQSVTHISKLIQPEYPAAIRRHTIRKHMRIGMRLSARLTRNDVVATGSDAEITKLCANGIGFFLPDATLEMGEYVRIAVQVKIDESLSCNAFDPLDRKRQRLRVVDRNDTVRSEPQAH